MSSARLPSLVLVGVVFLVVAAAVGLSGGSPSDDPDGDELVRSVVDGYGEFDTLRGTRVSELEIHRIPAEHPTREVTEKRVWMRPPDQFRSETLEATSRRESAGDVDLIDGSRRVHYRSESERMIVDEDNEWQVDRHDIGSLLGDYDAEYVGTETVDGRETYVVEIEPATNTSREAALSLLVAGNNIKLVSATPEPEEGSETSFTTTWWIDAETRYPLKERVEIEHSNPRKNALNRESRTVTTTYRNVTFDVDIPDERFTFEPPEGTTVFGEARSLEVDTVEAADETAPFPVPNPTVPDRFELTLVNGRSFGNNVTVEILYSDGDDVQNQDTVWIEITEGSPTYDGSNSEVLSDGVGAMNGTVYKHRNGLTVRYACDGIWYEVTADIETDAADTDERDLARTVATSIGCP